MGRQAATPFFKHKITLKYGHLFCAVELQNILNDSDFEAAVLAARAFGAIHKLKATGKLIRKFLLSNDQDNSSTSQEARYLSSSFKALAEGISHAVFINFRSSDLNTTSPTSLHFATSSLGIYPSWEIRFLEHFSKPWSPSLTSPTLA